MSSTKNVLHPFNLLASSTLSSTSLIYTQPIKAENLDNFCWFSTWNPGTPTGTFFLDASVDYNQNATGTVSNQGNWVTSDSTGKWNVSNGSQGSTSVFQAAGTTGSFMMSLNQVPQSWMRMRYVPSSASSSGVLNIWVTGKQI